ncbi:imidazole glycerol phosphate synthase subunit HisH [Microlunatus endophyticus]|uniref:Imidazole glycerol phosphate synthase subunit HisH n=1 Tax=Microlunatus endophyticus TaxID=1716077 RepID=A0A917W145_9ACTN|nr:imidazole glycerol phosphate synthase subunit HisH [Microlunatus endophyticus]GGL54695.1 imidazole glycerol phosphate synthase subunit HisH [Microlunatus endophyticus]
MAVSAESSNKSVVVLDYGLGNIRSAERAVARTGAQVMVSVDRDAALAADGLVVPGVGAFAACMDGLLSIGGDMIIAERLEADKPVIGICVGAQILFAEGVEHGNRVEGCGRWPGVVEELHAERLPHMGWNTITAPAGSVLFDGVEDERFYFVHSYGVREQGSVRDFGDALVTWAEHGGDRFIAGIEQGPLTATQFHPEKSGGAGAKLLANWVSSL